MTAGRAQAGVRAAWWAWRAASATRAQLAARTPLEDVAAPPPPALPGWRGTRAVVAVLRARRDTCLVRALVRQRWHGAHGDRRAVVIGVDRGDRGVVAHAWLEGDAEDVDGAWTRLAARPG
jgi:Transglutaminase-like superfamily